MTRTATSQDLAQEMLSGPLTDPHVFLSGRPPLNEFLGFLKANIGDNIDMGRLADDWRVANAHIQTLAHEEAGYADDAVIRPLPPEMTAARALVVGDAMFQRGFGLVPTDIGIVELDKLVVFQKHINLEYVERLKQTLGPQPSPEAVFRFCLPYDHPQPPVRWGRIADNAYVFTSPSSDLRFLESTTLGVEQIVDYKASGAVARSVALTVGFGSNFLNALLVDRRLILNNGSHRAFALRDLGVTHAPCIVQRVGSRDELAVVASAELVQNPDRYLTGSRPSVLRDYFDPRLRKVVNVPRRDRQIRLMFSVEALDMPASA